MAIVPIDPVSDPRVAHCSALLNGHTYHYLLGVPADGRFKATIFLVGPPGSQAPVAAAESTAPAVCSAVDRMQNP